MAMTDEQYLSMYGVTKEDMEAMMDDPMNKIGGYYMLTMSILSDAQECIAYKPDTARQYINKAKYVIRREMKNEY